MKNKEITPIKKPFSKEQIELIKRTVAKGATNDELSLYLIVANKTGLDPFSKQIHFVKRKTKDGYVGAIQTGIDGYRAVAERSGGYAGSDDPIYDTDQGIPGRATVTVYKIIQGIRCPFTASARWKEYCPPAPMNFMWNKMPYLMLGKVAESLALRKAFPNDLSGIYVEEEMERTGAVVEAEEVTVKQPDKLTEAIKVAEMKIDEMIEAKEVTIPTQPKSSFSVDNRISPEPLTIDSQPPVVTSLQNLFADARRFGAKEGEEAIFIQENLSTEIAWEALKEKDIAMLRTWLKSKLTK